MTHLQIVHKAMELNFGHHVKEGIIQAITQVKEKLSCQTKPYDLWFYIKEQFIAGFVVFDRPTKICYEQSNIKYLDDLFQEIKKVIPQPDEPDSCGSISRSQSDGANAIPRIHSRQSSGHSSDLRKRSNAVVPVELDSMPLYVRS